MRIEANSQAEGMIEQEGGRNESIEADIINNAFVKC